MLALNLDLVSCIRWHLSLKLSLSRPRHMVSRSFSSGCFSGVPLSTSHTSLFPFPPCFSGVVAACCSHASVFFEFELIWPIALDQDRDTVKIKDQDQDQGSDEVPTVHVLTFQWRWIHFPPHHLKSGWNEISFHIELQRHIRRLNDTD